MRWGQHSSPLNMQSMFVPALLLLAAVAQHFVTVSAKQCYNCAHGSDEPDTKSCDVITAATAKVTTSDTEMCYTAVAYTHGGQQLNARILRGAHPNCQSGLHGDVMYYCCADNLCNTRAWSSVVNLPVRFCYSCIFVEGDEDKHNCTYPSFATNTEQCNSQGYHCYTAVHSEEHGARTKYTVHRGCKPVQRNSTDSSWHYEPCDGNLCNKFFRPHAMKRCYSCQDWYDADNGKDCLLSLTTTATEHCNSEGYSCYSATDFSTSGKITDYSLHRGCKRGCVSGKQGNWNYECCDGDLCNTRAMTVPLTKCYSCTYREGDDDDKHCTLPSDKTNLEKCNSDGYGCYMALEKKVSNEGTHMLVHRGCREQCESIPKNQNMEYFCCKGDRCNRDLAKIPQPVRCFSCNVHLDGKTSSSCINPTVTTESTRCNSKGYSCYTATEKHVNGQATDYTLYRGCTQDCKTGVSGNRDYKCCTGDLCNAPMARVFERSCYSCVYHGTGTTDVDSCVSPRSLTTSEKCNSDGYSCYTAIETKSETQKVIHRGCKPGCVNGLAGSYDYKCCTNHLCNSAQRRQSDILFHLFSTFLVLVVTQQLFQ